MNKISAKLGFWSAFICLLTFILYMVGFIAIMIVNPPFVWTNLTDFVEYANNYNQFYKHMAEFSMLVSSVFFVILLSAIFDFVPKSKKILARIGIHFAMAFSITIGINYFIQFTAVRLQVKEGITDGLSQFVQSFPISGVAAINMLGWTVFFGLSSIFAGLALSKGKLEKFMKFAFIANAFNSFLGGIGYTFDIFLITFFTMYLGMGFFVMLIMISAMLYFKRSVKIS
ncbi:MAG: hypothetical protein R6U52_00810 [Kosmotogaceae bacterium]